jgi:hypothetical protein
MHRASRGQQHYVVILTQHELTIDLSAPAMEFIVGALDPEFVAAHTHMSVQCEIDNFRNTLLNLIERGVGRQPTDEELCS